MMMLFRPRMWFLFIALSCAGMLSYAIYVQHVDFLDPCPLCVFQRMVYMWIGAVALLMSWLSGCGPRSGQDPAGEVPIDGVQRSLSVSDAVWSGVAWRRRVTSAAASAQSPRS